MTWFLLKGLLRDRHRSILPVIVIAAGVAVTILMYCYLLGFVDDTARTSAKLDTGHVKIMTQAYAEISDQIPNDLALSGVNKLLSDLKAKYPNLDWAARIKFGGLLDFPDEEGETRAQGPVFGLALDLLTQDSKENERLNLEGALVQGRLPESPGEILVSEKFAQNLGVKIGEMATLISSTTTGSMAVQNFILVGTLNFGIGPMDRNAMVADMSDIQYALDMEDGAGEILGYFPNLVFNKEAAEEIANEYNSVNKKTDDDFSPVMITLRDQNGLGELMDMIEIEAFIIVAGFIFVMSIVLWNTGLMSGLRRYGEVGVRLAFGEAKSHVYRSMIHEAILIGLFGSVIGTVIGLAGAFYLQEHGLDFSGMTKGSTMLMSNIMRAKITPASYFIGFIPGLLATVIGTLISGIGIFRRQTSQLFKELET
ncbi:MAG: FtsX-like permease family protein [Deltaproteobacteria bacterium]|nr:FtsX-like permease family protein [Deltaproteobacteria bacterium]